MRFGGLQLLTEYFCETRLRNEPSGLNPIKPLRDGAPIFFFANAPFQKNKVSVSLFIKANKGE